MKRIIKWGLIFLFLYAISQMSPGCSSSKKTSTSTKETASHVVKKDSVAAAVKKETVKVNKSLTGVKTNSSKNRLKQKQTETETITTEYQPIKVPTDAKDYFPADAGIIRINDSLILAPKRTAKKQTEKKQSSLVDNKTKDSTFFVDTSVTVKEENAFTQVKNVDSTGTLKQADKTSKSVWRFQWWWLLPLLLIFLRKKARAFVGLPF